MEACVGINRTDDFLYESMRANWHRTYDLLYSHDIQKYSAQSVSVCETSCGFTLYCEDIEHA